MKKAFTMIRVSGEDQLKGYGPDSQWYDDVLPNARLLELEVSETLRRIIQEPATGWDRDRFQEAVREALGLYQRREIQAVLFPRVDRETRFLFGSFPLLCEVIRAGVEVYFAREHFRLDPDDSESVSRYLRKAEEAQAYVETMRLNTMRGRRRRAERDHMMPTGRSKWAHDYHPYRRGWGQVSNTDAGRYTVNPERAALVKHMADWILNSGLSLNRVCHKMGKEFGIRICRSTVVDILSDPAMIGKFYAYRTTLVKTAKGKRRVNNDPKEWVLVYEDRSQAILTESQFYALQQRFQRNRENSPRHTKHWYPPLRSLVFHTCGRRMVGVYRNGQPWYRCLPCGHWIKATPIWEQIRAGITEMLLDPQKLVPAIKAQLDSGQSLASLEEELRSNQQRMDTLEQAEQKALRLHLYLPNYPVEKLEAELHRIGEQRQQLVAANASLGKQLAEVRQANVDKEGLQRFCAIAARNLVSLDDSKWRLLLETMRLQVHVNDGTITVRVAVPAVTDQKSEIVLCTSRSAGR